MPTDSWYASSAHPHPPPTPLRGTQRVDVGILGGGLTGLSAALELAQAGYRVALLEAQQVGWGASGRSGGQVIFGFGCEQSQLTAQLGLADSRRLFDWSIEGIRLIHERCRAFAIDADWHDGHAHVAINRRQADKLKIWRDELATRFDYPLDWWEADQLGTVLASRRYLGALFDPRSGHLHPLNYTLGLARAARQLGVQVFEFSPVRRLLRGPKPTLLTEHGGLECDFVVLAGNAYVRGIAPELDRRIMPVGTYIGATEPLGEAVAHTLIRNGMAVADINWALDYFRLSHDHRLLFGGRASYSALPPPNLRGKMLSRLLRVFPQLRGVRLEQVWGGLVDISLSRAPHWGRLGDNLYYAQGFSGHGLATSGLAGRVIAEAIRGQSERLDTFSRLRHRPFPGGRLFRVPLLVAAMAWYKLRDALG